MKAKTPKLSITPGAMGLLELMNGGYMVREHLLPGNRPSHNNTRYELVKYDFPADACTVRQVNRLYLTQVLELISEGLIQRITLSSDYWLSRVQVGYGPVYEISEKGWRLLGVV